MNTMNTMQNRISDYVDEHAQFAPGDHVTVVPVDGEIKFRNSHLSGAPLTIDTATSTKWKTYEDYEMEFLPNDQPYIDVSEMETFELEGVEALVPTIGYTVTNLEVGQMQENTLVGWEEFSETHRENNEVLHINEDQSSSRKVTSYSEDESCDICDAHWTTIVSMTREPFETMAYCAICGERFQSY